MSDIKDLQSRALEIRHKYSELEKSKYGRGWTNEELVLGLVGDIGDLTKLVVAKEGMRETVDLDNKLAHEISDCLWSLLVLAAQYDIDVETVFLKTMDELEARLA